MCSAAISGISPLGTGSYILLMALTIFSTIGLYSDPRSKRGDVLGAEEARTC
jgi:hypothetical protein